MPRSDLTIRDGLSAIVLKMLISGSLDLDETLRRLSVQRPVFHSEADLQLALAWEMKRCDPMMRVRLETCPAAAIHLDIACTRVDLGRYSAIELKYLTRSWMGKVEGEEYNLKNHRAQDIRGYDVVKDIARIEVLVNDRANADGAVIVLTNDSYYWNPPQKIPDITNASEFRIHEGAVLSGCRSWGPRTGDGTKRGRERPIVLLGTYQMHWGEYSTVEGNRASEFRLLTVSIKGGLKAGRQG